MDGHCECPGGASPACCKHCFGVLALLEDYSKRELYTAPTERLQVWHQPRPKPVSPKKYSDFCPSSVKQHHPSVNMSALAALDRGNPIFGAINMTDDVLLADTVFYSKSLALPAFPVSGTDYCFVPADISLEKIIYFHSCIVLTLSQAVVLEKETMSQNCEKWREQRRIRLTASNVHKVCHSRDWKRTARDISKCTKKDLSSLPPIKLGRQYEPMLKNVLQRKFPSYVFRNTGLCVHPVYSFLGASPDGIFYQPGDAMLLEVKCTFNPTRLSLDKLMESRINFCLQRGDDGLYHLKKTHSYYTQVQIQMFCAHVSKCLFCLFYDFGKTPILDIISYDHQFCHNKLSQLCDFYFHYYLTETM